MPESQEVHVIIGASSGIGYALACQLVAEGAIVFAIARRAELLQALAAKCGGSLHPLPCDIADPEQVRACVQQIRDLGKLPDVIHLNAGLHEAEPEGSGFYLAAHKQVFDANYFGLLSWIEAFLPEFLERGSGTFLVTSSVMAFRGFASPTFSYGAGKAALSNCMEAMQGWYGRKGVRFVTVHPGPVDTRMLTTESHIPGTWSAEKSARYTLKKLRRGALEIHYPWHWLLLFRMIRLLPPRLFQLVNRIWAKKNAK